MLLNRNGVDTEEAIYRVTYYGKGRMPVSILCRFKEWNHYTLKCECMHSHVLEELI